MADISGRRTRYTLDSYMTALGYFVHRFAEFEVGLQNVMWIASGVDDATARAIFSGVRATQAESSIKRLHLARSISLDPMLEKGTYQLSQLMTFRNGLVHHGTTFMLNETYVSTEDRNIVGKGNRFPVSRDLLKKVAYDLETRSACLVTWTLERRGGPLTQLGKAVWGRTAQRAWQHIFEPGNQTR